MDSADLSADADPEKRERAWADVKRVHGDCAAPSAVLTEWPGILVPGGFGERGIEGKILAANYAREHKVPFLGICLGLQIAVIDVARTLLGWPDANSEEFDKETPHKVAQRSL